MAQSVIQSILDPCPTSIYSGQEIHANPGRAMGAAPPLARAAIAYRALFRAPI